MNQLLSRMRSALRAPSWKTVRQRASVLVLMAVALPVILGGAGLAIDGGNVYYQKSKLQNATDAAALSGAQRLSRTLLDGTETVADGGHDGTDHFAKTYIYDESSTKTANISKNDYDRVQTIDYKAWNSTKPGEDNVVYYNVSMTQDVQLQFLKFFGIAKTSIGTNSTAVIAYSGGGESSINNLFIVQKGIKGTNTIENPDNFDKKGQIITTFGGKISYTDGSGQDKHDTYKLDDGAVQYSTQSDKLNKFFGSETKYELNPDGTIKTDANGKFITKPKDQWDSVNSALAKGEPAAHDISYMAYDMQAFGRSVSGLHMINGNEQLNGQSVKTSEPIFDASSDSAIKYDNTTGRLPNLEITIKELPNAQTKKDDIVYMYIDPNVATVNVHVDQDNIRPLCICYMGKDKLHINFSSGVNFSGIVYAPNAETTLINANGGSFSGTIITPSLDLQGGSGTYQYKKFSNLLGGGSTGTNTRYRGTATVSLVV